MKRKPAGNKQIGNRAGEVLFPYFQSLPHFRGL